MACYICTTCGSQFSESASPPPSCPVCEDERQYVLPSGTTWTTHDAMKRRFGNIFREHEPNLLGIETTPKFGIGQRALVVLTPEGNFLWDCVSLVDEATVNIIKALGGLAGIAISHPHYYSSMVEWSHAFGGVPIHLHAADQQWIMRKDPVIKLWDGDTHSLSRDVTLVRCGGHFAGGVVLHWSKGAGGRGCLMTGDVIMVTSDRKSVSFMRSYPNLIPISAPAVEHIVVMVEPFAYDAIYGPFFDRVIRKDGKKVLGYCANRYLNAIRGDGSAERQ